jgi:hypothetical protein
MSNCPYCGTNKVSKTFNFNEYTCDLCECDYKHTSNGIKIFQEGSWATFCESIVKDVSAKSDANVVDLVSKTMRGFSKRSPEEIDLVIESLSTIAGTLNSEMKVGLRGSRDFVTMVEQINTVVRAAHTLNKRQDDLQIKIRLSESVLDWFKGDEGHAVEEGAFSDLDVIAQEAIHTLGEQAAEDEAVIAYVQQNHPDEVEHANIILQAVHDKLENGHSDGEVDESAGQETIDELVPVYKLETLDDPNVKPDLGIEPSDHTYDDEEGDDQHDVEIGEEEDPFAADSGENTDTSGEDNSDGSGLDSGIDAATDAGADDSTGEDAFASDGDGESVDNSDAIADVQDAAETVQDKFKRLEGKIDDLLNKVETLNGGDAGDIGGDIGGDTSGEDPFASEGDESEQPVEGGEGDSSEGAPAEGGDTGGDTGGNEDPFAESTLSESAKRKDKKMGTRSKRGDNTVASYQRKQSSAQAHKEMEDGGDDKTDMNADVEEENIPFTEGPKNQMEKDTDSTAPGATKKPTGTKAYREGFNGFRIGDEVVMESSSDVWNILGIEKNIFTLGRGKTTTKIDVFKEEVRHIDSRLEWQKTSELMGESKNRWTAIAEKYTTDKEVKITGAIGLGGGNRIGGEKFGSTEALAESTKVAVVETTAADRKDVYKYVKDNGIHRLAREVAVQRVCERFTNPIEEIHNIVDDAILSEDAAQVETIDSQYGYHAAPIGEHALRQAFQRGWQSVIESEAKEAKPVKKVVRESRGVGYYRTQEDSLIDQLGRTAADRLMGK